MRSSVLRHVLLIPASVVALVACTNSEHNSRANIETIVEEYILDNPQILSQSLQRLRESNVAAEIIRAAEVGALPIIGDVDAPITLIEFVDYNCGYCRRAASWVSQTVGTQGAYGDVRLIVVELPVLDQRTGTSRSAALAAIAAGFQNKYRQMHDALLAAPDLSPKAVTTIARRLGLNIDRFHADMKSEQALAILDQSGQFAQFAGITGTPAFFLNGQRVVGFDQQRLNTLLDQARS